MSNLDDFAKEHSERKQRISKNNDSIGQFHTKNPPRFRERIPIITCQ